MVDFFPPRNMVINLKDKSVKHKLLVNSEQFISKLKLICLKFLGSFLVMSSTASNTMS